MVGPSGSVNTSVPSGVLPAAPGKRRRSGNTNSSLDNVSECGSCTSVIAHADAHARTGTGSEDGTSSESGSDAIEATAVRYARARKAVRRQLRAASGVANGMTSSSSAHAEWRRQVRESMHTSAGQQTGAANRRPSGFGPQPPPGVSTIGIPSSVDASDLDGSSTLPSDSDATDGASSVATLLRSPAAALAVLSRLSSQSVDAARPSGAAAFAPIAWSRILPIQGTLRAASRSSDSSYSSTSRAVSSTAPLSEGANGVPRFTDVLSLVPPSHGSSPLIDADASSIATPRLFGSEPGGDDADVESIATIDTFRDAASVLSAAASIDADDATCHDGADNASTDDDLRHDETEPSDAQQDNTRTCLQFRRDAAQLNIDGHPIRSRRGRRASVSATVPVSLNSAAEGEDALPSPLPSDAAGGPIADLPSKGGKRVHWADNPATDDVRGSSSPFGFPSAGSTTSTPRVNAPAPRQESSALVRYLGTPYFDSDMPISVASSLAVAARAATPLHADDKPPEGNHLGHVHDAPDSRDTPQLST